MRWRITEPVRGDMIRTRAKNLLHYGIYVTDDEVIQFGRSPVFGDPAETVSILSTDIDCFLQGEFLEVAELDKKEKKKKRTPEEVVRSARARIGEAGYDILHNNCEHFVYECMFGEHRSLQAEAAIGQGLARPTVDVYWARIPDKTKIKASIYPKARGEEILSCRNERVQIEKYYVWRLLLHAIERSFGLKAKKLRFEKKENGQWICDACCFSLSHSGELVAVAVSQRPVGIDVELATPKSLRAAEKLFSPAEWDAYMTLGDAEKADAFVRRWTEKESMFKKRGEGAFSLEDTEMFIGEGRALCARDAYWLSVACDRDLCIRYFEDVRLA